MNNAFALASLVVKELYRRKDFYVLFILSALLTVVMGSINVFHNPGLTRYLQEICLLLIWISSLAIALTTTARQIPAEREQRTIFPLLAKPVSRAELILGKFLGCWLACGIALLTFYAFFAALNLARQGDFNWQGTVQACWLHGCFLAVVIAMTMLGSVVFTAPSSNITITLLVVGGMLLLGRRLYQVAERMSEPARTLLEMVYFAAPHLEFYDVRDMVIYGWGIPWWAVGLATLYGFAYAIAFLLATWTIFRKQALN